jgi:hypothetical protein
MLLAISALCKSLTRNTWEWDIPCCRIEKDTFTVVRCTRSEWDSNGCKYGVGSRVFISLVKNFIGAAKIKFLAAILK